MKSKIYYVEANHAWYEDDGDPANGWNFKGQHWKPEWNETYEVVSMPFFNVFPY